MGEKETLQSTDIERIETSDGTPAGVPEEAVSEAEQERRRLEEENELLRRELEYIKERNLKERIYDHVHVSVRTMDIFIGIMIVLFFVVVGMGLMNR